MLCLLHVVLNPMFHLLLMSPCCFSRKGKGFSAIDTGGLESMGLNGETLMDTCYWQLYDYVRASLYKSQWRGWLATYVCNAARIFLLYLSTCPLLFGSCVVVMLFWIDTSWIHDEELWHEETSVFYYEFRLKTPEFTECLVASAADITFMGKVLVILLSM